MAMTGLRLAVVIAVVFATATYYSLVLGMKDPNLGLSRVPKRRMAAYAIVAGGFIGLVTLLVAR